MKKILLSFSILLLIVACETGYKGEQNSTNYNNESIDTIDESKKSRLVYKEPLDFESSDREYKSKKTFVKYDEEVSDSKSSDSKFSADKTNDNLDIGTIRISEEKDSIRLVFDIYKWNHTNDYLGEKSASVGSYNFNYSAEKSLITAIVNGYRGFSAKLPKFNKNSIVEEIYMDEYLDDSGYKFHIKLRYDAEVKVFSLKNPGRIVVDITSLYQ
jgi:hypothetical protein